MFKFGPLKKNDQLISKIKQTLHLFKILRGNRIFHQKFENNFSFVKITKNN